MSDFKLTPAREKELEKLAKDLPDAEFKKRYGKDWKSVKIATAMNMLKKKYGFKEMKSFKEFRESLNMKDIFRKHKRELQKAQRSGNLELSKKAENDLMRWAMDNGEIKTDDPDDFDEWLDNNLDDIVKGRLK